MASFIKGLLKVLVVLIIIAVVAFLIWTALAGTALAAFLGTTGFLYSCLATSTILVLAFKPARDLMIDGTAEVIEGATEVATDVIDAVVDVATESIGGLLLGLGAAGAAVYYVTKGSASDSDNLGDQNVRH